MNIGLFEIPEGLSFPRTHKEMQQHMRDLARSMDLDLKFIRRKNISYSYCDVLYGKARISTHWGSYQLPILSTLHTSLHEIAHWMDLHNGLYRDFYARWGYKHAIYPQNQDLSRLGVRAERHCDWLASRMLWVMYGRGYSGYSPYDNVNTAREELIEHYELE